MGDVQVRVSAALLAENAKLTEQRDELLAMAINLVELCDDVFAKPAEDVDLIAMKAAIAKAEGRS